jgi:RNA-binding protein
VVIVGNAGLTPEVIREIETNLKSHELIKVRLMAADRQERSRSAAEICDRTGAHAVQHIGKIIVVYRARSPEEEPAPTRHRIRKPVKKTKRSYQTR